MWVASSAAYRVTTGYLKSSTALKERLVYGFYEWGDKFHCERSLTHCRNPKPDLATMRRMFDMSMSLRRLSPRPKSIWWRGKLCRPAGVIVSAIQLDSLTGRGRRGSWCSWIESSETEVLTPWGTRRAAVEIVVAYGYAASRIIRTSEHQIHESTVSSAD